MDTKELKLLAQYNKKTNEEMNQLIERISASQWDQQFGGYYRSIHSVCSHLYITDFAWLKRFGNLREFNYLKDESFQSELSIASNVFESQHEYLVKRSNIDLKFMEFVSEISEEDFERTLTFKTFKGVEQKRNFGGVILHVFNHQTHHRGMISVYLDSIGIENDYSGLLSLV
jgi:uncharacterized damage-inducible protein DinB